MQVPASESDPTGALPFTLLTTPFKLSRESNPWQISTRRRISFCRSAPQRGGSLSDTACRGRMTGPVSSGLAAGPVRYTRFRARWNAPPRHCTLERKYGIEPSASLAAASLPRRAARQSGAAFREHLQVAGRNSGYRQANYPRNAGRYSPTLCGRSWPRLSRLSNLTSPILAHASGFLRALGATLRCVSAFHAAPASGSYRNGMPPSRIRCRLVPARGSNPAAPAASASMLKHLRPTRR